MRMSRSIAFALLAIVVVGAASPAVACLLPTASMSPAEHECCQKMAHQCGSSIMPASHTCCQAQPDHTVVSPATYSATRPFSMAVLPHAASQILAAAVFVLETATGETPPPGSASGCSSILRI